MGLNQYAVYQLNKGASHLRYKSYQYLAEHHFTVDAENYRQVYLTGMPQEKAPEEIRRQLERRLPPAFRGDSLNVSDVIAITKEGIATAYYVDQRSLIIIPGFSGALRRPLYFLWIQKSVAWKGAKEAGWRQMRLLWMGSIFPYGIKNLWTKCRLCSSR